MGVEMKVDTITGVVGIKVELSAAEAQVLMSYFDWGLDILAEMLEDEDPGMTGLLPEDLEVLKGLRSHIASISIGKK
jgi:hypothetical protein